jgi:type III secretion protein V
MTENKMLTPSYSTVILKNLSTHGHFVMAAMVMGVVALMVVPVPPIALDLLIAFNISTSVLMLMLAIYIPGALGMSTFPSLIVLTTVLRLSLNIASTKQILLHAHAGNIIETFGRLVMGGQVVVGLVVFSIIAVVQFIVISKGAERVAEVGARFTLDAMPGKQMSIEADMRGGLIDKFEAKRQRAQLQEESQMYGSMDGAMKFVKGDAIASIIIAIVNIVGGIYVGVATLNMGFGAAMSRFTLLSVGDGMVSQIPSLLTSVAAGVLTTRLAGDAAAPKNLATQIGVQVMAQPRALLSASAMMFVLLFVPGFPKLPFLVLTALFGALGWQAMKKTQVAADFESAGDMLIRTNSAGELKDLNAQTDETVVVAPLMLRVASNVRSLMSPAALQEAFEREKNKLQMETGLSFPALQVKFDDSMSDNTYAVDVQEIPSAALAFNIVDDDINPSAPITNSVNNRLEQELALAVANVVRHRSDAFVGMQEINALVKRAQNRLPDLSEEVLRAMPMQRVAEVLRRLALEGVSLRYLREIYESLLTWSAREKDTALLCECVRMDLGRFICHRFIDIDRTITVMTLDSTAESIISAAIKQGANGAYIALSPEVQRDLIETAVKMTAEQPADIAQILLVTQDTRRFVRRILAARLPQLHILSYSELPSDVQIKSSYRLSLPSHLNKLSAT